MIIYDGSILSKWILAPPAPEYKGTTVILWKIPRFHGESTPM